ncbi:MAG: hypothetical protein PSX36_03185 [bacterium]|nr:hypothetical protein [bacterium]
MPSLPPQLLNSLNSFDHFNEVAFVAVHSDEHKITSLRLNPFKKVDLDLALGEPVPWNSLGYYLDTRPSFTLDPLFHAGCYYVQEAGSMFLEFALKQYVNFEEDLRILDISAAPGGKSTLINSLMSAGSLLVANEIVKTRAEILAQNLSKWGTCNTMVTNSEPSRFSELSSFFDVLVLDAPCSGSGLFRKQPEAIDQWSESNVEVCSIRQRKIIEDVLPSLKEGGILFYSTCSYSHQENEDIVRCLVEEHCMEYLSLPIDADWGIVETPYGYRFYPHLTKSEGFFCALLRKQADKTHAIRTRKKTGLEVTGNEKAILRPFIPLHAEFTIKINERYHAMSVAAAEFIYSFAKQFYFKKAGIAIGEIKGNDVVPNHELAMALEISPEINYVELDKENALKFLRKETFSVGENQKGFSLMRYKHQGLGWAKILPNRVNNYLPNELRILK